MLFNSIQFAVFIAVLFVFYWILIGKYLRLQNLLLLIASYFFYGCWDWRFLFLIAFSSLTDYFIGIGIGRASKDTHRKALLLLSLVVNIGLLGVFKYFNFFSENFSKLISLLGQQSDPFIINIILPVGISFYTFQTLS